MKKTALITGITGQDGSYLAELLLEKGYQVVGFGRKKGLTEKESIKNIAPIYDCLKFAYGDLMDFGSLFSAIQAHQPDEVYNLAAQSHPGESWRLSLETGEVTGLGAHRLFEAIRQVKPSCRVYQACSSEMFGEVSETPQSEKTSFNPVNPYAVAKVYAYQIAKIYRRSYSMFIGCGILFNHESPRRGMHFITQKVAYAVACIKLGILNSPVLNEEGRPIVQDGKLALGNLDAKRDWGFAGDYVDAMWRVLQHEVPDDFVIGTGRVHSIRELCEIAFSLFDLNWQDYVVIDQKLIRPIETKSTVADPRKAERKLNWKPKMDFPSLIRCLVEYHHDQLSQKSVN